MGIFGSFEDGGVWQKAPLRVGRNSVAYCAACSGAPSFGGLRFANPPYDSEPEWPLWPRWPLKGHQKGHQTRNPQPETGFTLVSAIFLLVVLAALGAFLVKVSGLQHASAELDVQSARAYQAARAGIEWGAQQALDPGNISGSALPPCPASPTSLSLAGTLAGFSVSVTCSSTTTTEANRDIGLYVVTATASSGTAGSPSYVERQLTATLSKCKDPTAPAPAYACG